MTVTTGAGEGDAAVRGGGLTLSPIPEVEAGPIQPQDQGPDLIQGLTVDQRLEAVAGIDPILAAVTVAIPPVPIVLDLDHALLDTPELFNPNTITPEPTISANVKNLKRKISSRIKISRTLIRTQIFRNSLRRGEQRLRKQS